eukprot:m51a1_g5112 hypothetical protein (253) ;mRNA; r:347062-348131
MCGDLEAQEEEFVVLESMYGESFSRSRDGCVELTVAPLRLRLRLPATYPSQDAPEVVALVHTEGCRTQQMRDRLESLARELVASFEPGQEEGEALAEQRLQDQQQREQEQEQRQAHARVYDTPCPEIIHGEPLTDRKSKFIAHAAVVRSREQVEQVRDELMRDRRVAVATHNICAYRIVAPDGSVDEQRVRGQLLFMLDQRKETEAVVVVSRWFGGILLGPDRFRHINNTAHDLLESAAMSSLRERTKAKAK